MPSTSTKPSAAVAAGESIGSKGRLADNLTLDQVLAELGGPDGPLPRSTWHAWQRRGIGPRTIRLSNGQTRVARDDLNSWLDGLTRDPAAE
jgi:hypothetical protein